MFRQFIGVFCLGLLTTSVVAQAPHSQTYVVQEYAIPTAVTLGGTVVPYKEVTLSAQLPGRVELIAGEEGDRFKQGTALVALNGAELLAQRRAAFAEMMSADAVLRNASMQYSRELYSPNSPNQMNVPGGMALPNLFDQFFSRPASDFLGQSHSGLDRYTELHNFGTQIEQARNAKLRAQSQIEQIDAKLRDAVGKAPFDGIITQKMVEVGDTVQPGTPLVQFADTEYLQIQIEVPARLVPGLNVGMTVPAKLDVLNTPVQVRVAHIFPVADPIRHTVTVKFDLPIGTRTGPGQYAQVDVQDTNVTAQVLPVIPRSALVWRGSLPGVYVRQGEQRSLRLVRIGRDMDTHHVSVLSGLKHGDVIELSPAPGGSSSWSSTPKP
ncbi:efflux RND transporter periplasmic adaptor subunit [Thioflexithrix psekupsensis]|uniref:Efflux transporter periplasmic adaptor subunit n=1 Tax=Thioflexithrix psekupsensis TaxID=1570016 RepID=A0A251X5Z5_9GAMM|nr:efflux RND transporter periplasmic adaptor subunit [Thioflexithrix psekupsensis]OUD13083.1 efflux transporter periplasmic adaptor subunit [Thioflexithrix psekupsensis]